MTEGGPGGGAQVAGEEAAAEAAVLFDEAEKLLTAIRSGLARPECKLLWGESTFGRVFSFAALSHECILVDQMVLCVRQEMPSAVMALLCRSHLETWLTGVYLWGGGAKALATFLGQTTSAHEKLRNAIEGLHAEGRALDVAVPALDDFDWAAQSWNFFEVARDLEKLGTLSGLFSGALANYQIVYRALSGLHGTHPTHRFLDGYVETPGSFARVLPGSQAPPLRRALLQYAVAFTAVHASFAFAERGLPVTVFGEVYLKLIPSGGTT